MVTPALRRQRVYRCLEVEKETAGQREREIGLFIFFRLGLRPVTTLGEVRDDTRYVHTMFYF